MTASLALILITQGLLLYSVVLFGVRLAAPRRGSRAAAPWPAPTPAVPGVRASSTRASRRGGSTRRERNVLGMSFAVVSAVLYAGYYAHRLHLPALRRPFAALHGIAHAHSEFGATVALAIVIGALYGVRALFGKLLVRRYPSLNDELAPFLAGICLTVIVAFTFRGLWALPLVGDVAVALVAGVGFVLSRAHLVTDAAGVVVNVGHGLWKHLTPFLRSIGKRVVLMLRWIRELPARIPRPFERARHRSRGFRDHAEQTATAKLTTISEQLREADRQAQINLGEL